jgi:hypothetical protein
MIGAMTRAEFAPEFLFVAACCRWPASPARDETVRANATKVEDWTRALWLAKRHRIAGLVHSTMAALEIPAEANVARELGAQAQVLARRNLLLAAETARLQGALEAAGIPAPALKGVALAQLAYGSLNVKDTRDIDLLVAPDRAEAALAIAESEGYALTYPAEHLNAPQLQAVLRYARELQLVHREKKVRLELQWRTVNIPMLLEGIDARSATQRVSLSDGLSVRTLSCDDLFAYLAAHGAQHAWSRLKWLADFNALLAPNLGEVERLYRHAQRAGAAYCAGQALLLCQRLFDTTLPPALASEIEADGRSQRLVDIAIETLGDAHPEAHASRGFSSKMRVTLSQFLLGKGWRYFAAQCRVQSVRTLDIVEMALPRPLHFLYPLLRLPLFMWRRIARRPAVKTPP